MKAFKNLHSALLNTSKYSAEVTLVLLALLVMKLEAPGRFCSGLN